MILCPWCGTHYQAFQPNCKNCGGPIPAPASAVAENGGQNLQAQEIPLLAPPPAPRQISDQYATRLMLTDGWAVTAGVFLLLGGIFLVVGIGLTLGVITAFVGIPFFMLGILFLGMGGAGLAWRYQEAMKMVNVLRHGEPVRGQIIDTQVDYSVRINHRYPWKIRYQFKLGGQEYQDQGKVSTLNTPGPELQPGCQVYVLYLPDTPAQNVLYPHP